VSNIICKEFIFDASHRLVNLSKSSKWNKKVYGKCNNKPSHGHTFRMIVELKGDTNIGTGFIVNFVSLKQLVNELVIEKLDHHFINEVDFMKGKICTCENLIEEIWKILDSYLIDNKADYYLKRLTIYETATSSITKEVTDTELAWLAGFIDGDGSISISKASQAKAKGYYGNLGLYNTNKNALQKAAELMGVRNISETKCTKKTLGNKKLYNAVISKRALQKHLLLKTLPYLVEKRKQGLLLLMFINSCSVGSGIKLSKRILKQSQKLQKQMELLNDKGRSK